MAPMNWTSLFILFMMVFLLISIFNYFSFMYNPTIKKTYLKPLKLSWKW